MSPPFQIGTRFLMAKRRALAMSLAGIVFGVAFIILAQAVTSGFQKFFIRTILGTDGAVRVEDRFQATRITMETEGFGVRVQSERRYESGVPEPRLVSEAIRRFSGVLAVSEVVRGSVTVNSATREDSAQLFGVRIEDHLAVSDLGRQIVLGSLEDYRASPNAILIGRALADRIRVTVGDTLLIEFAGRRERYRIAALYETGVREIDRVRIYADVQEARTLMDRAFGASYLQVALADPELAPALADQIESVTQHRSTSWQEREQVWLDVFRFFQIAALLLVATIIIVSGLGMFNTLAMIVMEKTREIAILRSMGYTRGDIAAIFMWQGWLILAAGLIGGMALGALGTAGLSRMPIRVRGIFATDRVMVSWSLWDYAGAALAAAIVVSLASWLPARRAAALEPAGIIRGSSQ